MDGGGGHTPAAEPRTPDSVVPHSGAQRPPSELPEGAQYRAGCHRGLLERSQHTGALPHPTPPHTRKVQDARGRSCGAIRRGPGSRLGPLQLQPPLQGPPAGSCPAPTTPTPAAAPGMQLRDFQSSGSDSGPEVLQPGAPNPGLPSRPCPEPACSGVRWARWHRQGAGGRPKSSSPSLSLSLCGLSSLVGAPSSAQPPGDPDVKPRTAERAGACLHGDRAMSGDGRHVGRPPRCPRRAGRAGEGRAHLGLAQQLLELGLRQEAVVLHKGGDLGGAAGSRSTRCRGPPCTCSGCPGPSPYPRGGGGDGASPRPRTAEPARATTLVWRLGEVRPVLGRPLARHVTQVKPVSPLPL